MERVYLTSIVVPGEVQAVSMLTQEVERPSEIITNLPLPTPLGVRLVLEFTLERN